VNIFVLDKNPITAAEMHCDKHVPKMCVEAAQMMASALRRHGATDGQMPLTKAGTPYRGGYAHHPCTVWAGDSRANFSWLALHALALCEEYTKRFDKEHACSGPIEHMARMRHAVEFEEARYTPFAQAMPDEYRDDDAVKAYRAYYHSKQFAKWEKGTPTPDWWRGVEVSA
jgi:hypothetical protein|tara:strand:- start:130 stop:642 length:513 start_codon:yes stop_codon:yes gene_type:complete